MSTGRASCPRLARVISSPRPIGRLRRLEYLSQLQPYTVYVPKKYDPSIPEPLTLFLHSLNEHYYWINDTPGETLCHRVRYS